MKKNDRRFLLIFIIIVTLSVLYLFQTSYAKYKRQATGTLQAGIAAWNIKVNTEDINNKVALTNQIIPTFDANNYVKSGVIAPGSTGHFQIVVDATNVDVDFNFTIQSVINSSTPLADFIFTRYEINGTSHTFNGNPGELTGTITKNTASTTITVYFAWNDNPSTNTMNNQADTEYAIDSAHEQTVVDVSMLFTQKNSA